jgi:ribosomal protein L37E
MEQLVTCKRCGSNACLEQQVNEEVTTQLCMGCGFTTSTLMTEGSEVVTTALETSPELYKDLMYKDQDGNIWMPSTLTLPNKGMVFVDGTNTKDWSWAAVKAIPLEEGDKKLSDDQTHKMDMKNLKHYAERDFMDALEHIGFFAVQ